MNTLTIKKKYLIINNMPEKSININNNTKKEISKQSKIKVIFPDSKDPIKNIFYPIKDSITSIDLLFKKERERKEDKITNNKMDEIEEKKEEINFKNLNRNEKNINNKKKEIKEIKDTNNNLNNNVQNKKVAKKEYIE